jgi:pantoate--beta-alanine ligase
MRIVETIAEMQQLSRAWQKAGDTVGLVPTMGALHEGHVSLVHLSTDKANRTIVTIFVNPTQFGAGEDLGKYPRTFEADKQMCEAAGVDVIFFPSNEEMYFADKSIWITEETLSKDFCGASRPTHFRGVVTVVAKLFNATLPHFSVFGEKDYQQLQVLKRLVRDLNYPIEIIDGPIFREKDGLAMSSRNRYLSEDERRRALAINRSLREAVLKLSSGVSLPEIRQFIHAEISLAGGEVDYIETVHSETLEKTDSKDVPVRCLVAAKFGPARLLDNLQLI